MAISKPKKPHQAPEDLESLKTDVASFASSLGLAPAPTAATSYGFDDSDFRKFGPLKTPLGSIDPIPLPSDAAAGVDKKSHKKGGADSKKPTPKSHPLQIDPFSKELLEKKNSHSFPLVKANSLSGRWFVDADELELKVLGPNGKKKFAALEIEKLKKLVEEKTEVARRLVDQYTADYESSRKKTGDMKLLEVTTRSGTSADKVSAFTCLVEDNPIANMKSLDALLSMVTSKVGKRYAFTGFEALKELFLLRLLPDRKLKSLFQRPLDILPETKDGFSLLLFWYWEECLKKRYERFVIALEESLKDMLPNLKNKAMKTVFNLLKSKPEQERKLLSAIVNKLGDPERKAASGAMYHLSCLLSAHPNMKAVVIDEVDAFIFRPNIGLRAKYQAVNFLSQILLSKKGDGPRIAKRLIDIYFALFKVLITEFEDGKGMYKSNKKDDKKSASRKGKGKRDKPKVVISRKNELSNETNVEMDSRLLSALLTGVNRAFPFVASDEADNVIEVQTPLLFRLVHSKNFNVGVQALMLLYQISSKNQIASDRFYRALYAKLLTTAALSSSKPEMFLGLLVKSMKNDLNLKRVAAFSKRLMQVALQRPPQFACGCLFILSEVLNAKPSLWSVVLQNENADDDIEHFEDIIEIPEDLASGQLGELANLGNSAASEDSDKLQDYERNHDSEGEENMKNGSRSEAVRNGTLQNDQTLHTGLPLPAGYNPRHREPSYCNADRASWWELTALASHVHPSVATMARTLLSGANIVYNGDPLNDLSLVAFIDKFMEKKPKPNKRSEGSWHGGSQIAPARKLDLNNHLIGDELLQLAEDEVPPEDVVFHRFYMNKSQSSKKLKKKKKNASEADEDAEDMLVGESDESDEEEEIDKMLVSEGHPLEEVEGDYDYDDLDRIAEDDDDDLLGSDSDVETGPSVAIRKHPGSTSDDDNDSDDDDDDDAGSFGEDDDDVEARGGGSSSRYDDGDEPNPVSRKKRKLGGKSGSSPFASLEEYEHLMSDEVDRKKPKSHKKKKRSS